MLKISVKNTFKKDLKKAAKNPKQNIQTLKMLIDEYLVFTGTVPTEFKPHILQGGWKPHMECHVQPDFLLIWDIDWDSDELILVRCGSHSELFG